MNLHIEKKQVFAASTYINQHAFEHAMSCLMAEYLRRRMFLQRMSKPVFCRISPEAPTPRPSARLAHFFCYHRVIPYTKHEAQLLWINVIGQPACTSRKFDVGNPINLVLLSSHGEAKSTPPEQLGVVPRAVMALPLDFPWLHGLCVLEGCGICLEAEAWGIQGFGV